MPIIPNSSCHIITASFLYAFLLLFVLLEVEFLLFHNGIEAQIEWMGKFHFQNGFENFVGRHVKSVFGTL